jgi:hypothetical protein
MPIWRCGIFVAASADAVTPTGQLGLRSVPAVVWHPVHLVLGHAAAAARAP